MTSPLPPIPNVIIAGVSKCGTTSLFRYLASHPEVCASSVKEIDFFTRIQPAPGPPDVAAYAPYFERCGNRPARVHLEASPGYLHQAGTVAPAMRAALPDVRLIFILRDPVERFVSHFRYMQLKPGRIPDRAGIAETLTALTDADGRLSRHLIERQPEPLRLCIEASEYADNLERFLDLFGPDRVHVTFIEHLERSPAAFMDRICSFLQLPGEMYSDYQFSVENKRRHPRHRGFNRAAEQLNRRLERVFNRHPALRTTVRRVYFRLNPAVDEAPEHALSPETEAMLRRHYAPSVGRLRDLLANRLPATTVAEWVTTAPAAE